MNHCTNCGAVLRPTDQFCSSCGKSASRPEGEPPPVPDIDGLETTEKRNSPTDERSVRVNKTYLIRTFVLCLVFAVIVAPGLVAFCVVMGKDEGPLLQLLLMVISILCSFGALILVGCAVALLPALFSNRPGLLLNSEGFEFPITVWKTCFVRWRDVAGFREHTVSGTHDRVLVVIVKDQERYVQNAGPGLASTMKSNMAKFGGPIAMASMTLAIDFDELLSVFSRYLSTYRT